MQTGHKKTKIVLDADVIIHFMEASELTKRLLHSHRIIQKAAGN